MVELVEVTVGDAPALWAQLGFLVEDDVARLGRVDVCLSGSGAGITGWRVAGLDPAVSDLDGLPVDHDAAAGARSLPSPPPHPNGVIAIDHVVLTTPDMARTIESLSGAGFELRRVRDAGRDRAGRARQQAFFWLGEVILEVVGPAEAAGTGPPMLWGLALTGDLEAAAAHLGERLRSPKPAVQPGRMIATIDRSAGSTVPMVIMSPHASSGAGRQRE